MATTSKPRSNAALNYELLNEREQKVVLELIRKVGKERVMEKMGDNESFQKLRETINQILSIPDSCSRCGTTRTCYACND